MFERVCMIIEWFRRCFYERRRADIIDNMLYLRHVAADVQSLSQKWFDIEMEKVKQQDRINFAKDPTAFWNDPRRWGGELIDVEELEHFVRVCLDSVDRQACREIPTTEVGYVTVFGYSRVCVTDNPVSFYHR